MARRRARQKQEPVRKPLLIVGGVAVGAALLGFILMNFVLNGGGGEETPAVSANPGAVSAPAATPTPATTPQEVTPGGRDPFTQPQGLAPIATPAPPTPAPAVSAKATVLAGQATEHFTIQVVSVYGKAADVKVDGLTAEGAHAGDKLADGIVVQKVVDGCATFIQGGKTFSVCQGQTLKV